MHLSKRIPKSKQKASLQVPLTPKNKGLILKFKSNEVTKASKVTCTQAVSSGSGKNLASRTNLKQGEIHLSPEQRCSIVQVNKKRIPRIYAIRLLLFQSTLTHGQSLTS